MTDRGGGYPVIDLEEGWAKLDRQPGGDEDQRLFEVLEGSGLEGRWLFTPHRENQTRYVDLDAYRYCLPRDFVAER